MNDSSSTLKNYVLITENLCKSFYKKKGLFSRQSETIRAVHQVSIKIESGETVGLVGESGCGKTTFGRAVLKLYEPTSGRIIFQGKDITSFRGRHLRSLRQSMQLIFQDPYSSLNPRFKIRQIIAEGLYNFKKDLQMDKKSIVSAVNHILQKIGLPEDASEKYPHQFSGGQRQRICIGRAIALRPGFIVCDEPLSALDVSIRSQILNLLLELKNEYGLSYLFISHDLKITSSICSRIYIMYLGEIVEELPSTQLFANPLHPYTQALISAVPEFDAEKRRKRIILEGDVPSPVNIPEGCPFHPRCPKVMDICRKKKPHLRQKDGNHTVSCWLYENQRTEDTR
ncbi:MAG: ABC transporter ATP-binding protein [Candidatus Aureabacteria bacterium]|nr:ABC transporter ATP-binding protein [Candidatus Auribacterota bacterium]